MKTRDKLPLDSSGAIRIVEMRSLSETQFDWVGSPGSSGYSPVSIVILVLQVHMIAASFPCAFSECLACMARFTTDQVNSSTQISVSLAVTLGSLCSFDWSYFPISSYNLLSFAWICIFEKNQKTLCVLTF